MPSSILLQKLRKEVFILSKKVKKGIILSSILLILIAIVISVFFIKDKLNKNKQIQNVIDIYCNEDIQERIDNEINTSENNILTIEDMLLQIDGEKVLGVIEIQDINYQGLVYEGTNLSTLAKGVGHFSNTPYLYGNVCLAAHNTNQYWAKLHTLENGNIITYYSFLGTKQYEVFNVTSIEETDWTNLENTEDNILTLITCIRGQKERRLCVQAREI